MNEPNSDNATHKLSLICFDYSVDSCLETNAILYANIIWMLHTYLHLFRFVCSRYALIKVKWIIVWYNCLNNIIDKLQSYTK